MTALFDETGLRPVLKTGRCANGSQLDHGVVIHIASGVWGPALCGTKPGRRSCGWADDLFPDKTRDCPRCFKKLAVLTDE